MVFACVQIEKFVFVHDEILTVNRDDLFRRQGLGMWNVRSIARKKGKDAGDIATKDRINKFNVQLDKMEKGKQSEKV